MIGLSDLIFQHLLPGSIAKDDTIKAAADSLDRELKQVSDQLRQVLVYHRLDELEGDVLNLLAWQFNVDFFDIGMPDAQKRECIRDSIAWHKKKGTPWAVKTALANAGYDARIITYGDARKVLEEQGTLRLDGTWGLEAGRHLGEFPETTGVAWMEHWAEFCVKMDLLSTVRTGWEKEVRSLVTVAKNARSHPVYFYFANLETLVPFGASSSGGACVKDLDCLPLECDLKLDGEWKVGRDRELLKLDGTWQVDGFFYLGQELMPAQAEKKISNCRTTGTGAGSNHVRVYAGRSGNESQEPYFSLELKQRCLDGSWTLGSHRRLDGTWRLGDTRLSAPILGKYAVHQLNSDLKVGHKEASSTSWPAVGGSIHGSSDHD